MIEYVGIGDVKIAHNPEKLAIIGLGSCVCVAMYDESAGMGGVSHVMLPEPHGESVIEHAERACKYATVAVPVLMKKMIVKGAKKEHLKAKIAGGASIFRELDSLEIGDRNVAKVKEMLRKLNISIVAEDTGGNLGRTVIFDTKSFKLHIKTKSYTKVI